MLRQLQLVARHAQVVDFGQQGQVALLAVHLGFGALYACGADALELHVEAVGRSTQAQLGMVAVAGRLAACGTGFGVEHEGDSLARARHLAAPHLDELPRLLLGGGHCVGCGGGCLAGGCACRQRKAQQGCQHWVVPIHVHCNATGGFLLCGCRLPFASLSQLQRGVFCPSFGASAFM